MPKAAQAIETPTPRKRGPKPKAEELAVTTVRLRPDQWQWLKKAAFERALQGRSKPDASAIMRELVDGAMTRKG